MSGHWFEPVADHLGSAYLRYSFTRGTDNEVAFVARTLGLGPGARVLDVGCGPGRHARALAAQGCSVVGVDISQRFVELATEEAATDEGEGRARFVRGDARRLPVAPGSQDAVISLCQGGFGLLGLDGTDGLALGEMAACLRPGGRLAVSAFSAYFQLRWLEEGDSFDASTGVNHERTSVRSPDGDDAVVDLWTTCFTPRELTLLAERVGLTVDAVWGVTPGDYGERPPSLERPEHLLVAHRR